MAVTSTIEYCEDRDLLDVYPQISEFDLKRRLYNWVDQGSNEWKAQNTGLVTVLFADGVDKGTAVANEAAVDSTDDWFYDSGDDFVRYYSTTDPNSMIMESGDDWTTIKTRFRRKASRLIESHLDNRMSREVNKDREGNYPQIIVHATALQTVILLLKAHDPTSEVIAPFQDELNEILEGLKAGSIVLPSSVTADSSKGVIRTVSINNSSDLFPVELKGHYNGVGYDNIKIKVITGGVIGTATYSVWVKDNNLLKNKQVATEEKITGDYDHITSGLYMRWSGDDVTSAVATANDEYEIEVYSSSIDSDMSSVGSISMSRR
tara:strand:+ start:1307 stop:2266 length:960 start_codon:yes stop_codon:yes gene_type:complete